MKIEVTGAKVHNLDNVSVSIPRHRLVVITGLEWEWQIVAGTITIFAEGQRRYMDTYVLLCPPVYGSTRETRR